MVIFTPYTKGVIVGLILSDGWLIISNSNNARLGFKQALFKFAYVWDVFNILSHYCSSSPCLVGGVRAGNRFYALQFLNRLIPFLTELHTLFYPNKVKVIPSNIYELLTLVALAHIVMADGKVSRHGLVLCTDSYSVSDIVGLINVLIIKYRLDCTLRYHTPTQPRIYIKESSMLILRYLVTPYMVKSMFYKID